MEMNNNIAIDRDIGENNGSGSSVRGSTSIYIG